MPLFKLYAMRYITARSNVENITRAAESDDEAVSASYAELKAAADGDIDFVIL